MHQEKRLLSSSPSEIQNMITIGGGISGLATGIIIIKIHPSKVLLLLKLNH